MNITNNQLRSKTSGKLRFVRNRKTVTTYHSDGSLTAVDNRSFDTVSAARAFMAEAKG